MAGIISNSKCRYFDPTKNMEFAQNSFGNREWSGSGKEIDVGTILSLVNEPNYVVGGCPSVCSK
jgi:hypothetical protein